MGREVNNTKEFWSELVGLDGFGRLLLFNDFADAWHISDKRIGFLLDWVFLEFFVGSRDDRSNGPEECEEDGELDDKGEDGAKWLDVVALIEVHHLHLLDHAVAFGVFANFGELWLDFAHEAGLFELLLDERPHTELHDEREDNNSKTEITDKVVDDK